MLRMGYEFPAREPPDLSGNTQPPEGLYRAGKWKNPLRRILEMLVSVPCHAMKMIRRKPTGLHTDSAKKLPHNTGA